jgi:hypothetical protein
MRSTKTKAGIKISPVNHICIPMSLACAVILIVSNAARGQTVYDATADYEAGWTSQSNPNGVWSYGYSSGPTAPVTLYNAATFGGTMGEPEQFWLSPAVNIQDSPAIALNDGPAFVQSNGVNFLADELVLVAGVGGQYSNIVFTAPASGFYSLDSSFRGDQTDVGTFVGVAVDGTAIFSSSVTVDGGVVPFDDEIHLNAGDTVDFSVGPAGGFQNTGFAATITSVVPEPSSVTLMAVGVLGLLRRRVRASKCRPFASAA